MIPVIDLLPDGEEAEPDEDDLEHDDFYDYEDDENYLK